MRDAHAWPGDPGRVLVVEDEALVAFELEDMLHDLGFSEVTVCASYDEAERALDGGGFGYAVFDLNLSGVLSVPLVERAHAEGIRTIITSGYERSTVPAADLDVPRLTKPYDLAGLARALRAAAAA